MNKFNSNCATIALGASLALLSACGGGGDGGSSGGSGGGGNGGGGGTGGSGGGGTGGGGTGLSVQGGFGGTINLTKGNRFEMIVLEDGTFWTMYGNATNGVVDVVGFIEGTSTQDTQAHTFASGDSHDFGLTPVAATTLAGAYSAKSISGTIAYSASSQPTFSGSPIPTHQYDYDAAATVADAQGSWAMVSLTGVQTTLNVASDGTFVGSDVGGCSLGGSLVPRASGKNVFDLALQFGATCPKGATAYNGIALLTHVSGGSQLVLAAIDEAHGSGVAATGLPVR